MVRTRVPGIERWRNCAVCAPDSLCEDSYADPVNSRRFGQRFASTQSARASRRLVSQRFGAVCPLGSRPSVGHRPARPEHDAPYAEIETGAEPGAKTGEKFGIITGLFPVGSRSPGRADKDPTGVPTQESGLAGRTIRVSYARENAGDEKSDWTTWRSLGRHEAA